MYNARRLARVLGLPYAPISPWLPVLGPLAYLPMPVKFHIRFGAPLRFEGPGDDEDAAIDRKVDVVKQAIRDQLEVGLAARKGLFR